MYVGEPQWKQIPDSSFFLISFFLHNLLLIFPINLFHSPPAAYLFSPHSIKKCNNDPSSLLEYCILVSSHPPNFHIPSAVLSSVISGRNHVIPEIPAWQIQKYFSTSALVYWYVYIINMPALFLNCRQRRERVLLCCQINTLQNIYKMGHPVCSP